MNSSIYTDHYQSRAKSNKEYVTSIISKEAIVKHLFNTLRSKNYKETFPYNNEKYSLLTKPHFKAVYHDKYNCNPYAEFDVMILHPQNHKSLFIFNENTKHYFSKTINIGRGSAAIRPYRVDIFQFERNTDVGAAIGIPIGFDEDEGFSFLNTETKKTIDIGLNNIDLYLAKHKDTTSVYWFATSDFEYDSESYRIAKIVKKYILTSFRQLAMKHNFDYV